MDERESVMIDTSAFYALVSASDRFHSRAVAMFETLIDRNRELWTTSYALIETVALVHRRLGFDALAPLLDFIESNVNVLWVESALHDRALGEFRSAGGAGLSVVDGTLALAARMKMADLFTFDGGMQAVGVPVVPAPAR